MQSRLSSGVLLHVQARQIPEMPERIEDGWKKHKNSSFDSLLFFSGEFKEAAGGETR